MISAKTAEARVASPRNAVSHHVIGPHLRDQEYAVALTAEGDPWATAVKVKRRARRVTSIRCVG